MLLLLGIFWTFVKFGLLCFGGGYMLIPLLIAEFVGPGKLLTAERFGNLVSISQVTPGPVGINTATFVGYLNGGFWGALAATVGLVAPTLLLAGAAVSLVERWKKKETVQKILYGARLGALALMFYAVFIFLGLSVFTRDIPWKYLAALLTGEEAPSFGKFGISLSGVLICAVTVTLMLKTKWKTTWLILFSGVLGALLWPWIG